MKHVVVGTSGHVDHGKTCLIKALTGTDTDRLKEEKKRGITIELGFANMPCDEGVQIGIVDVPGHEKFVKNMLAGIGGIDLVLFVVALDEGVMPQTREHFDIIKTIGVNQGILVFTKKDMVDDDFAELVVEDTKEMVKGSFLENAESIMVSAYTGENIEVLRRMIIDRVKNCIEKRNEPELFRLPIDRVFTMEGFGTVITGTLMEGSVSVGDEIFAYPSGRAMKVRGIQNHGNSVETAYAGQRTAINLSGIKKEELERGEILCREDSIPLTTRADALIKLFDDTKRVLKSHDMVHISYGSAQTTCKMILLDKDVIKAGEEAFVQLIFEEPVPLKNGDKYIIRFISPVESFGGGFILEPMARKHKNPGEEVINKLQMLEGEDILDRIEAAISNRYGTFPSIHEISVALNLTEKEVEEALEKLKKKKILYTLKSGSFIHKQYYDAVDAFVEGMLKEYHTLNPVSEGMEKQELISKLIARFHVEEPRAEELLYELIKRGVVSTNESAVKLIGFESSYTGSLQEMHDTIREIYKKAGIEALTVDEIIIGFKDKKTAKQIVGNLLKEGAIVRLSPALYIDKDAFDYAVKMLKDGIMANPNQEITLGEYRDMLETSRKFAVQLLEAFDSLKITKKIGDARKLV